MLCDEYLKQIRLDYDIAKVLSNRNDSKVILLKHNTLAKYIVYRQYSTYLPIYDYLLNISFENLPLVYDRVICDDGEVVLEQYINSVSVADVLQDGTYTYKGAKKVIIGVCNALNVLHKSGYVHRDIKPENVLIANDGTVKLIDFNAARQYSPTKSTDTVPLGTIGYASPEQLGLSQTDLRADIYAVGVLLNVMLTGEHPSVKLAKGKAGKIVLKCTRINPNSRFKTISDLISML